MKLALALLALSVFAGSDESAPERELADLFASTALAPLDRVADLPPDVARTLRVSDTFWMADPGQSWNLGCVRDSSHPEADRRLVIAGKSPSLVAVYYETGGIARGTVLELLRVSSEGRVVLRSELRDSFPAKLGAGRYTAQNPS